MIGKRWIGVGLGVALAHFSAAARELTLDGYAARVNNRVITVNDIMQHIQPTVRQLMASGMSEQAFERELRQLIVQGREALIGQALVLEEFAERIEQLPEALIEGEVEDVLRVVYQRDRSRLLAELAEQGLTYEEWRQRLREQLLMRAALRQEVGSRVQVTPSMVQAEYEARRDTFQQPPQIDLRLIQIQAGRTDVERSVKRAEIERVRERLLAGEDFGDVAREVSEGSRAQRGGDWGWVETRAFTAQLAAALEELTVGEVSPVVEVRETVTAEEAGEGDENLPQSTYYLALIEGRREAVAVPLAEVYERLEAELREQEERRLTDEWLERLRARHYVELYDLE